MTATGAATPSAAERDTALTGDTGHSLELYNSIVWLIQLRWIALAGLTVSLVLATLWDWTPHFLAPALTAAGLAAVNLVIAAYYRVVRENTDRHLVWSLWLQLNGDLVVLHLILHWTGGVMNPFAMLTVFPVTLAAMLLPTRMALASSLLGFGLFAALIGCQLQSDAVELPLAHDQAALLHFFDHSAYLAAVLVAAAITLLGITYFVHSIVRQRRVAEFRRHEHERIARSRARMARVGTIAAGVAHSVRNPLHGVLNGLDLVREEVEGGECRATLDLMGEGLRRIEQVTARLLSLTRDAPLQRMQIDLVGLIHETLRLLAVRMDNCGIEVCEDFGTVPKIRLDPVRLQEALFNVLDNAIAAVTGQPLRRIVVRLRSIQEPLPGVTIEIQDSGPGVEIPDQLRVFDPFFSTKPVGEGTGLGLAIAKEIVEAHGGEIEFQSNAQRGTLVRIRLPLDEDGGRA